MILMASDVMILWDFMGSSRGIGTAATHVLFLPFLLPVRK